MNGPVYFALGMIVGFCLYCFSLSLLHQTGDALSGGLVDTQLVPNDNKIKQ